MITVLMAVYNGEAYLMDQMDSIFGQTISSQTIYGQTIPRLKVIVSDDGSSDKSRELILSCQKKAPDLVFPVFRTEPSGSAENHFFALFAQAEDDYIMLSDQDDVWLPKKTERLLEKMRELEGQYGTDTPVLVHSDMKVVDKNLEVIAESYFRYQKISPERNRLSQLLVQNNVTGGAVMINRALLAYLKKKPEICLMHDNWMALVASCFGVIGWVDEPLYLYRQHEGNTLGAKPADTVGEMVSRLKDGSRARENYRRMFGQARCLLEMYGEGLDSEKRETLEAFLSLSKAGRLEKIDKMIRYGFTKNSLKRTIGQMLFL